MVWILCLPVVVLYTVFGSLLVKFFMDQPSEAALNAGVQFLLILAPFYFVISTKLVADGILRGAGLMKEFMIATFTDLILRVVLTIAFSQFFGLTGIWFSWPIGWSVAMILSVFFYIRGPWSGKSR